MEKTKATRKDQKKTTVGLGLTRGAINYCRLGMDGNWMPGPRR